MIYLFPSSFGNIIYDWDGSLCRRICLNKDKQAHLTHDDPVSRWLESYFNAKPGVLPPLYPSATDFQQTMRQALLHIPFGEVRSYGEIAKDLHTSPRGIGQALKANALPILIPCHRIVAAHGLGGFSGGEEWKMNLLTFEAAAA